MLPRAFRRTNSLPGSFFNDFFNDDFFNHLASNESGFGDSTPAVNVEENDKEYVINVAAPGVEKKDFNINVNENELNISTRSTSENEQKKAEFLLQEFNYNSFSRSFTLPDNTDINKIKASHKNGILQIVIPKEAITVQKAQEIKII